MESNLNSILEFYRGSLRRKENLIASLMEKESRFEERTISEEMNYSTLSAEIRLIKEFIEELEAVGK